MKSVVVVLALFAGAASAQMLPQPEQFIDRSVIVFPDVVDNYALGETSYDPALLAAGVTSKWNVQAAPRELRLTVFIYPVEPADEAEAVANQLDGIALEMQQMVRLGSYTNLVPGERSPFEIDAPAPSLFEPTLDVNGDRPPPAGTYEDGLAASHTLEAALQHARPLSTSHGQRQRYTFDYDGVQVRSIAYVFYRQLYAVKVRATTPVDSMDDSTFEALADTATRTLVPHIRVENYGECGIASIASPELATDESDTESSAKALLFAATMLKALNCRTVPDPRAATAQRGETRVEIVYPPGTWTKRNRN